MRLIDRIYLVGGSDYGYSAPGDCNVYMVDCGGALALIDTGGGKGIPMVLGNIRRMGFDPVSLDVAFLTHCHYDHIGGNKAIKESTGCDIAAHEIEKDEIETLGELTLYEMAREEGLSFEPANVDVALHGNQRVKVGDLEFEVIHTPGHTPGGISLMIQDSGTTSLFSGDTALAGGRLGYINGPGCDLKNWKTSIKKLLALRPERLFPGHGVFVLSGATDDLALLDQKMNAPWINIVTSVG
jgi:glyoxylase-like metal-dependent hydrolase (beta-lactamase superfamily II)